jgi:hypothetical protein
MTALQSILKEAKALKKSFPKRFKKWTDYVRQASAIYASKHKGKSPVGKKHAVKKKAVKKAVKKKTVVKKKVAKKVVHKRKPSEKAVLKSIKHAEKVQIRHMSGIGALSSHIINDVKNAHTKLVQWQKTLITLQNTRKSLPASMKKFNSMDIKRVKDHIKEIKTHIVQLKKQIK